MGLCISNTDLGEIRFGIGYRIHWQANVRDSYFTPFVSDNFLPYMHVMFPSRHEGCFLSAILGRLTPVDTQLKVSGNFQTTSV